MDGLGVWPWSPSGATAGLGGGLPCAGLYLQQYSVRFLCARFCLNILVYPYSHGLVVVVFWGLWCFSCCVGWLALVTFW